MLEGIFYCVESHQAGHYWLVVGDAAGKGISSCLYSLVVRSLIRSYGILYNDVGKVLSETNNAFLEQTGDSGMFVTALMGEYDASSGVFSYYSCGHTPGLIKRQDGAIELLAHSGMALGLLESTEYQVDQVKLGVGDTVIFFTSGLIGGVNEKNQYFSEKRLRELLQQRKWISSQEIVNGLVSEYQAFIGSASQEAEVVIVTMQIKSKLM